ncbi:MAG: class I SAM-dependent methyltransferase [Pseudomonadota bacterium]
MQFQLRQRGRSSIDFAASLSATAAKLRPRVDAAVAALKLPEDLAARLDHVDTALRAHPARWFQVRLMNWASQHHGQITSDAFDEIADDLDSEFERLARGPTRIETRPGFQPPSYWDGVAFHRTTGGWTREHQGFIHGELIHPLYVARNFPGGIFKQRRAVLDELSERDYLRILELGTSSGHFTVALAEHYPNAEITGVEPSVPMLEQAQRFANERGWRWRLIQGIAEETGLPDESFDLVTSYILLHELPVAATRRVFAEAFRLLEPGGTLFMSDVRPFRDMDALAQWRQADLARRTGEPHWCDAASLDLSALATEVGFEAASSYGVGSANYPWVTVATKP